LLVVSYLDQLEAAARAKGVTVAAACIAAGLPDSTYWRWQRGRSTPSLDATSRVMRKIQEIKFVWPLAALPDWPQFIAQLKAARHRKGISQLALDEDLGNPQGLVAKWECGDRRPTAFNLYCWASALDVDITLSGAAPAPMVPPISSEIRVTA
jgi:hypothetical protein